MNRKLITATLTLAGLVLAVAPIRAQEIGELCLPGEPAARPGLSCQATGEFTYHPPYILNAKRGDVVISPGCGLIGGLMRTLPDRQFFSHSGIMVEDRNRIRHSTAHEDLYRDAAGSDGFSPAVLKWGWPGVLTESIDHAYEGNYLYDPEGNARFLKSFNRNWEQCLGDPVPHYPSVIKPPFDMEGLTVPTSGETVRDALHRVADETELIDGHYRFFGYTEADLVGRSGGPGAMAGPEAGWAWWTGKPHGTVCSQLVWSAARAAGLELEGPAVEPGDKPHSAPGLNGLYRYSTAERRLAADWLYGKVYDQIYDVAGFWGELFTTAADDGGNQIVNCFAFDWCGEEDGVEWDGVTRPQDSERWRDDPGPGDTVSPDDMINWDLPTEGGLYGLTERMSYRTGSWRPHHRWAPSAGTGDLRVTVEYGGVTLGQVPVSLEGFDPQVSSGLPNIGIAFFEAVPAGQYWLEAATDLVIDNAEREIRGGMTVTVAAGGLTEVVLELDWEPDPPTTTSQAHRRVSIAGQIAVRDDGQAYLFPVNDSIVLDPVVHREHTFTYDECTPDAKASTRVLVRLDPDDFSVFTRVSTDLYQGGGCASDDHDAGASSDKVLAADSAQRLFVFTTNVEHRRDDWIQVRLNVRNERNATP